MLPSSIHRGLRYNLQNTATWHRRTKANVAVLYSSRPSIQQRTSWKVEWKRRTLVLPSSIHRGLRYNNTNEMNPRPVWASRCRPLFIEAFDTTEALKRIVEYEEKQSCRPLFIEAFDTTVAICESYADAEKICCRPLFIEAFDTT